MISHIKKLYILLFILFLDFNAYSQVVLNYKNSYLIKSTVAIQQDLSSVGIGGNSEQNSLNISPSSSTKKIISRTITFSDKQPDNKIVVARSFDRIQTSLPTPVGVSQYDSNNPFEEDEGAKGFVHGYLPFLKEKIKSTIKLDTSNFFLQENDVENESFEKLWNNELPALDTVKSLDALYFTKKIPVSLIAGKSWTDSVFTPVSISINKYTVIKNENNQVILLLNSKEVFGDNKTTSTTNTKVAGSITIMSSIKSRQFDGEIILDPATKYIYSMKLKTTTESSISFNGNEQPSLKNGIVTVENELKFK